MTEENKITIDSTAGGLSADNSSSAAKLQTSGITDTDFVSGSDLLRVDATAPTVATLTGTQLSEISSQSNLLLAANKARELSTKTKVLHVLLNSSLEKIPLFL